MARRADRGEGPINYLAVVLLIAVVTAAVTVVAIPNQVTGSIRAAACRVVGQDCGGQNSSADDPQPQNPGSGQVTPPDPGTTNPDGTSPEDPEYQNALGAYNKANHDATAVENEWNSFNLLNELAKLGMDFLFGDIKACLDNPNIVDCLWALVGIVPWGKLGKFFKMIPKLIKLAERFLDLRSRLAKARKLRDDALRKLREIEERLRRKNAPACTVPSAVNGSGSVVPAVWKTTKRPVFSRAATDADAGLLVGASAKPCNLPSWKKVDIDLQHIIDGHTSKGSKVKQGAKKDLFPDSMTDQQIARAVRQAYRNSRTIRRQGERVLVRGIYDGIEIEMWVNTTTKTIETAYPVRYL